jgi:dolichol-phosphate mannosyltransferase
MVEKDGPAGDEAVACKPACDEGALMDERALMEEWWLQEEQLRATCAKHDVPLPSERGERDLDPSAGDSGRSLVVIPTYNEAQNLGPLVERVLEQGEFDVLVIDDSSADGTGELADRLAGQFPGRISVLHRRAKLGLGSAITTGLRHALHREYAYVFQMDADLSHDPCELPAMRRALERVDIVVGSRYATGAATVRRPRHRELLSRLASVYARALLGIPLSDPTGGYRGYRRRVLEALNLDQVVSRGYAVQIELNHRCHQAGFRFQELPIAFAERDAGRSKMSLGIVFEALVVVAALRLTTRRPQSARTAPVQSRASRALLQFGIAEMDKEEFDRTVSQLVAESAAVRKNGRS